MVHTPTKNGGNRPMGSSMGAKTCFVFFLSPMQSGLSATYPAPILTTFEAKAMNWMCRLGAMSSPNSAMVAIN